MTVADFSRLLRKLVAEKGISYTQLADKANVSSTAVLSWANDKHSARMDLAIAILDELGYKLEVVPK